MTRRKLSAQDHGRLHLFFTAFSNWVAKWTGSHWTFTIVGVLVVLSLVFLGVERTTAAIAIVTLLMVFVLQNTQNRDSAALHLKLDEMVGADPDARDEVRGVESKSEPEIRELSREEGNGQATSAPSPLSKSQIIPQ
jgi:low affinity Fe/Cu permease